MNRSGPPPQATSTGRVHVLRARRLGAGEGACARARVRGRDPHMQRGGGGRRRSGGRIVRLTQRQRRARRMVMDAIDTAIAQSISYRKTVELPYDLDAAHVLLCLSETSRRTSKGVEYSARHPRWTVVLIGQ